MYCRKIKIKSGYVWECVEDAPRDPATGKRRQIKRRGRTQGIAKERVEKAIELLTNNGIDKKINKNITFSELAEEWLKVYSKSGVKDNTVINKTTGIKALSKYIGATPVNEIGYFMFQNTVNELSEHYAYDSIRGFNSTARQIFRFGIRVNAVKENPVTDIVIPKKVKTVEEIQQDNLDQTFMEMEEINEFILAIDYYGLELDKERFYTLLFSGMRPGELCALQKKDLCFETNTISVTKTLFNQNQKMDEYELTAPKTLSSIRDVNMEQPIMDMLKKLVRKNDKHKMKYRHVLEDYHDNDFVFCRKNGYPFTTKTVANRMRRLMKKTNIKKSLTPHSFRHTHISMLTEAGIELPTIMKRVGHEDPNTTLKIYTHVTNKMEQKASEKITNYYGGLLQNITF